MGIPDIETLLKSNDTLLGSLIRADEASVEPEIEQLIVSVAWPLIERIAAHYTGPRRVLPGHEAEDVMATVGLRLLDKLRRTRSAPGESIQNVEKYVSTLTHNVINDHLRRRFPLRARLKNRLRYILTHDARFDLWKVPGGLACGLREWSGSPNPLTSVPIEADAATRAMRDRDRPADALRALFDAIGKPVGLEALIHFIAAIWHIVDLGTVDLADRNVADRDESVTQKMERREFLGALWREIQELQPMQRKALLLNLRESANADGISLLVLTGTAHFDEIAAALGMSVDRLSAIWNKLPFDDLQIGELLNITRQQVINLRGSARARLQRRLFR